MIGVVVRHHGGKWFCLERCAVLVLYAAGKCQTVRRWKVFSNIAVQASGTEAARRKGGEKIYVEATWEKRVVVERLLGLEDGSVQSSSKGTKSWLRFCRRGERASEKRKSKAQHAKIWLRSGSREVLQGDDVRTTDDKAPRYDGWPAID